MPLEFVQPSATEPTLNFLLYGPAGTGKSTGAASAPGPILYGNAEGPNALRFARRTFGDEKFHEFPVKGKADLDAIYLHCRDGCEERTVVLDSIGEVYEKLIHELGGDHPTIQQWGDVNTMVKRFVLAMRDVPVNLVLICHEEIVRDEQTGEMLRQPVTGGRKLPSQLMQIVDVVGYTGVVPATDTEPAKYVAQLIAGNGRHGKDRTGVLGSYRDLNLSEWLEVATAPAATETEPARRAA